eukprot:s3303_g6.t1
MSQGPSQKEWSECLALRPHEDLHSRSNDACFSAVLHTTQMMAEAPRVWATKRGADGRGSLQLRLQQKNSYRAAHEVFCRHAQPVLDTISGWFSYVAESVPSLQEPKEPLEAQEKFSKEDMEGLLSLLKLPTRTSVSCLKSVCMRINVETLPFLMTEDKDIPLLRMAMAYTAREEALLRTQARSAMLTLFGKMKMGDSQLLRTPLEMAKSRKLG